jgi:outer membrane usher protein
MRDVHEFFFALAARADAEPPSAVSPVGAADETLELALVVNGYATGQVGEFTLHDGALLAHRDDLHDLGFRVPPTLTTTRNGEIALAALPCLKARLDQATQTLYVSARDACLLPTILEASGRGAGARVESGLGLTLNYDVIGNKVAQYNTGSGAFNLRAFSPWGVLSSDMVAYAGSSPRGPGTNEIIRLSSTYVYSDPDSLRQYSAGDFVTSGLAWTRPVRFGGLQISSDFALRPDLVTFPIPSLSGSVAVPSAVNVLVNGEQLLSRQVQPGPFQIPQLPLVTGAGTIAMTVTDAIGRQTTTIVPFYSSAALLAPGLQSYAAEIGAVRHNYGTASSGYSDLAAAATYRRGLSSYLTVESHAEGSSGLFMGGGGLVVNVGNFGAINFAAAGSTGAGQTGTQISFGAQRIGRMISLSAAETIASRNFRDIAAANGDPVARRQLNASASLSLGWAGSFSLAYTGLDSDAAAEPISFFEPAGSLLLEGSNSPEGQFISFVPAQHTHLLSASYSRPVNRLSFYATGFHDVTEGGNTGIMVGFSVPLGRRSSASAALNAGPNDAAEEVSAAQTPEMVGDWGYQVQASTGSFGHQFGELQYMSRWGLVSAGADRTGTQTMGRAEAQGALSLMAEQIFASNTINDSFAVVDTNGIKGIRVLDENRPAGVTGSAGTILVPDLRAFEDNHISIDPTDVPIDAALPFSARNVRPQDRSGVLVRFPIHLTHGAVLTLVDPKGQPVPVGSTATLAASGAAVPVGYDGKAFIEGLHQGDNVVVIVRPDGRSCIAAFRYRPIPDEIPSIGPLQCQEDKP